MSTTTATDNPRQRKPRTKPERRIRLAVRPNDEGKNGLVVITVGTQAVDYFLCRVPSDWGQAFSVEKIGGKELYHVHLDGDKRTCDCKGHARWGHCKHADGLAALAQAGKL